MSPGLMDRAAGGDRDAIREVCVCALGHLQAMAAALAIEHDDLTPFLVNALRRISDGDDPNTAFGWTRKRGRPKVHHSLRNWEIRAEVQERMRKTGEGLTACCLALVDHSESSRDSTPGPNDFTVDLAESQVIAICEGLTVDTDLDAEFWALDL